MGEWIGVSGSWKAKTGEWIGIGGNWKAILGEWIGVGGVWKRIYAALSASASPTSVSGSGTGPGPITSNNTTVTVTGGSGSVTHSWARISGSTDITANQPDSGTTNFQMPGDVATGIYNAIYRDTVTDDETGATAFADVSVQLDKN